MATPDNSKETDEQDLLVTARKRFDLAAEAESEQRRVALEDKRFRAGEQWPDDIKSARAQDNRPCLTINRLPQFSKQIINDIRQNRPSIKVNPVDDKADVETAKILQGIIRHIEYNSNADVAYDTAIENAVDGGLGYFRVITDFCDPQSFDQEIFIKRIRDAFSVYFDPHSQEPDGSDANWAFVFEEMSEDDFKAQYPNAELSKMDDWHSIGDRAPGWVQTDSVRVAEYFYKTFEEKTLLLLASGEIIPIGANDKIPKDLAIKAKRKTILPSIKWCKLNGLEVLEETDWPGQWIPIIPVIGDEIIVDGKRILEGIIRHAKDPQRMYNYWASAETETIALAPRAPFIGAEGQFEGHEAQWKMANTRNLAYLQYKPVTLGGQPASPPQRQVYEPPVQAITQARMQSSEDLKATTGIYDASLGNRSNENSGIAIQRRNQQAQTSNFHFVDNLSRAIRHAGRIIIDLIPKVYDTPRAARIIGEDGEVDIVKVNQLFEEGGKQKSYSLGAGKYDVTVSTGPSYQTKRQEASQTMLEFTKSVPQSAPLIADLIARNMDWPGADLIADRLKKTLPPGVAEQDDKDKQPLPPQAVQQMSQMSQMIEQLTQHLNQTTEVMNTKKLELESRERIAAMQAQTQVTIAMAQIDQKNALGGLTAELDFIKHRLEMLHAFESLSPEGADEAQVSGAEGQPQPPTGGPSPGTPMEQ